MSEERKEKSNGEMKEEGMEKHLLHSTTLLLYFWRIECATCSIAWSKIHKPSGPSE